MKGDMSDMIFLQQATLGGDEDTLQQGTWYGQEQGQLAHPLEGQYSHLSNEHGKLIILKVTSLGPRECGPGQDRNVAYCNG